MTLRDSVAPISRVEVAAYRVPTEAPESDGTLCWHDTTLVVVRVGAGGEVGLGYTYADRAVATLVHERLGPWLCGRDALQTAARRNELLAAVRNLGPGGLTAMACAALDVALWDLKGHLLALPLTHLLGGAAREDIPAYGSGGFTSMDVAALQAQLGGWAALGLPAVKMKVGRAPDEDGARVRAAREAIGEVTGLFVDANGAYTARQALAQARAFETEGVTWFEEPVPQRDAGALRWLRGHLPGGMALAAGEYGWILQDFTTLLQAGAVDVLQADVSRCGLGGFMAVAALCEAFDVPLSSHCAPALHVAACCCTPAAVHLEWFHDHVCIEQRLFDGVPQPCSGRLAPALDRPGLGLSFREADAMPFRT